MKREQGVRLEGLHLFIAKVVELAEECEKAANVPAEGEDAGATKLRRARAHSQSLSVLIDAKESS